MNKKLKPKRFEIGFNNPNELLMNDNYWLFNDLKTLEINEKIQLMRISKLDCVCLSV